MRLIRMNRTLRVIIALVVIAVSLLMAMQLQAADELMKWKKLDTMDTNFTVIKNKAGDNELLLELDLSATGNYSLKYYLENGRQTEIKLLQSYEKVDIQYFVRENPGAVNITQSLVSLSYLQMDYSLTVPDWKYNGSKLVGASGGLEFSIARSASSKYPGVAFDVDNKRVLIKWDFQAGKAYVLIKNYKNGFIMPIEYTSPTFETKTIKALKRLESFVATPTHIKSDGTSNVEIAPMVQPNTTGDTPGNRPGLDIKFKQPKEMDPTTWQYNYSTTDLDDITAIVELDDIGSESYLDFNLNLKSDTDNKIYALDAVDSAANAGVTYIYDPVTYEYTIRLVKNNSDLIDDNTIAQWSDLNSSSIYNVTIGFQVDLVSTRFNAYEFTNYSPINKFAYSYMGYELKRSSVKEAYLDIIPYNTGGVEEVEYVILYSKVIKTNLDIDEDLWLKNYHSLANDNDEIFIPVPFRSTSSQDAYQIYVNFAGIPIKSQVLNYKAIEDFDVPPTTPSIKLIENLFVVPPLVDGTKDPAKVQLDLVWDAPTNKEVQELDSIFENNDGDDFLYYELSVNDVPTDSVLNPFKVIKVFEVYKEGGLYKLRQHTSVPGTQPVASALANYVNGYNKTDEVLRMEKIILFENGSWVNTLNTLLNDVNPDTYTVTDSGTPYSFELPGVNYLRVRAITIKDGELAKSQMSIPSSLSLSMITYDIPIVDTLSYKPLYGIEANRTSGITLNWHSVNIVNYENYMLSPINKKIENVVYGVYIAQQPELVLPLETTDTNYTKILEEADGSVQVDTASIDLLRDGKVIYFEKTTDKGINKDLSVDIKGLDVNRDYYVRVVTKLAIDNSQLPSSPEVRRSTPSSVLSATVPKIPAEPGDAEIFPLSPERFDVTFADESLINAGLTWYMPGSMLFEDNMNGFEILALEDRSLPDALRDKAIPVLDILTSPLLSDDVVEGWRLFVSGGITHLTKYNRTTGLWDEKDLSLVSILNDKFYVIDDANAPNKVNYYYVRTTKMSGTSVKNASPWTTDTLTTAPVKGPINLAVDYVSSYTFDPKSEFIIRFDAPIPDVASIGSSYVMEVHVKGENDSDYSITKYPSIFQGTGVASGAGYKRLYYKITGLTPGKTYDIKVRIEDRTKVQETLPDGTKAYPKSPFSDLVVSRTEFDQETYDKENKFAEYLKDYTLKAETLKQLLYFKITNSTTETAVKYRENYSEGMIKRSSNGELYLYTDNKSINTFYIPSNSLESINDYNVTLKILSKDQLVGIRPDSIGVSITKEIKDMVENIKRYNSTNKDYYLRVRVFTDTYNGQINSLTPASPLVQVEMGVVGSLKLEENMDTLMVSSLESVILANRAELIIDLENELAKGINDSQLLSVVEKKVKEVETEYVAKASIIFKGNITTTVTMVNQTVIPMYVALEPQKSPANNELYTKENGLWKKVESSYFNNRYYVDTKGFTPYVLLPTASTTTNLISLYAQSGVDVINLYNLSGVFTSRDFNYPLEAVEKYQWVGSLARLIGAKSGEDTATYLNNRGIAATTTNNYLSLRYDEALAMYVDTYAYRHKIDLKKVVITNYNAISDLSSVESSVKQKLLIGVNMGIIKTNSGKINPSHQITMKEAMQLLVTLHNGMN